MHDSRKIILKTEPKRLAALLEIDSGSGRLWRPDELGAIFKHQLASRVNSDLADGTGGHTSGLPPASPRFGTFEELFHDPKPQIECLTAVKEFAKANRDHPASALPKEIATVLYYTSVIVARWRCGAVITALNDEQLRAGIQWAIAERWVDARTRSLLCEASKVLIRSRS